MPQPGAQLQAMPMPAEQLQMERPGDAPMAAPAGEAQPMVNLQVDPSLAEAPLSMSAAAFLTWHHRLQLHPWQACLRQPHSVSGQIADGHNEIAGMSGIDTDWHIGHWHWYTGAGT